MAVLIRLLCVVMIAAATGCTRDPARFEYRDGSLAVHAVLVAGSDRVVVRIARFEPAAGQPVGVGEAEVRLLRGSETIRLAPAPPAEPACAAAAADGSPTDLAVAGCYTAIVPDGIRSGERFELRVALPGGASVVGSTTIPEPPQLLAPLEGSRIPVGRGGPPGGPPTGVTTVGVRWQPVSHASRFEVGIVATDAGTPAGSGRSCLVGSARVVGTGGSGAGDLAIFAVECRRDGAVERWDSVDARLIVTAYDTAYTRYAAQVIGAEAVLRDFASAGLSGASGVFGAAASTGRRVTLVNSGP